MVNMFIMYFYYIFTYVIISYDLVITYVHSPICGYRIRRKKAWE